MFGKGHEKRCPGPSFAGPLWGAFSTKKHANNNAKLNVEKTCTYVKRMKEIGLYFFSNGGSLLFYDCGHFFGWTW